jgi:hypothetical protein
MTLRQGMIERGDAPFEQKLQQESVWTTRDDVLRFVHVDFTDCVEDDGAYEGAVNVDIYFVFNEGKASADQTLLVR